MSSINSFNIEKIALKPDYEGEVTATLISSPKNQGNRKSILYIHGFMDYFFHPHLADAFSEKEYDFYALDLRKCGRSILPHQKPYYCEIIEEYFEEIDIAIEKIKAKSNEIYLLGHSNGGLISSTYMSIGNKKNDISGLILNSPFFDLYEMPFLRNILYFLAKIVVKIAPKFSISGIPIAYGESLHKSAHGEWDYDLKLKPIEGFPTYFKWAIGIVNAQRALPNANIQVPVLLLHSDKSLKKNKYSKKVTQADIILDVEDMKRIGPKIGKNVTLVEIKNGMHDLFLSKKQIREDALNKMFGWLNQLNENIHH